MEINFKYQNGKRFKNGRFLPFVIIEFPSLISKENKEENKTYYIDFNASKITEKKPSNKKTDRDYIYIYLGIALVLSVFLPIYLSVGEDEPLAFIFVILLVAIGIPFLILAYIYWQKYKQSPEHTAVTFDRENTLLTMPKMSEQEYFTIPFQHLKATKRAIGARYSYSGQQLHFFNEARPWRPWRPFDFLVMALQPWDPISKWSLYVWYMDKNRPLPPGTAFDEFRDKDFERRKTEGFPPPLFKSTIPTPEATAQQQLLRDNHWKDEEYIATDGEVFI